ncbi:BTAD domain-containing putative transcriptional regulator [Amycolatopsis sp. WQ 127309]|uniref:AfsR/SARP family transcriptional regulator n=1 Tax=Amycolatopsis sp. WQ 127309 TaxID=2932773 RepID=UPI001FF59EF4|nr:BTAD domain-containing putative transcriptional regulator [Amycolatopsis sp. WQ 127309]UOZ10734.1 tetratricopeptide repeat protein [Amycolatopsis sp. WQ 127309]
MGTLGIHLLGPLLVRVDGETVPVPGGRPAALLAVLALAGGRPVTTDALVEQIWGDRLGDTRNAVAVGVSRLRKVLGAGAVVAEGGGYRLTVPAGDIDVSRFTELVEAPDGPPRARLARVEDALALWRGEPLAGVGIDLPIAVGHLRELRLRAQELAAELRLELDEHHRVAAELPALVAAYPLRERFTTLLMTAQYRCGRQSEALQAFEHLRKTLADELGVDPGPGARRMHQRILEADPELDAGGGRAVPAQLPPPPPRLVGRAAELAALDELTSGEPSIGIVTGPAGVGKTALTLAWAHAVRGDLPGGQLYLDLNGFGPGEPLSPEDAVTTLLQGLAVTEAEAAGTLEAHSARLRTALAGRRLLLVLDNARDSAQVLPLLPGSGCVTVVTSRARLPELSGRHAARRLVLDALGPADSVRLLGSVAGHHRMAADPAATRRIADLCDRVPLATVILAERIARSPDVPVAELAAELADEQRRLDALEVGGDLAVSMRVALGWSYGALPEATRAFLRAVGAHPVAEFDLAAAAAAAGIPCAHARHAVDELTGLHLARRVTGSRVALHDLVREYAGELLQGKERTAALARLLAWYQHTVAAACTALDVRARPNPLPPAGDVTPLRFGTRADALRWCETEGRAVLALAGTAARAGLHDAVGSLAGLYWTYLDLRGRPHEVRAICRLALDAARAQGDVVAEALHLNRLGIAHLLLGEFAVAEEHGRAALALDRAREDHAAEAETLVHLARILIGADRPADAIPLCRQALARLARPETGWRAWNNLATAQQDAGHPADALQSIERALHAADLLADTGDRQQTLDAVGMRAYSRDTRGHILLRLHRNADALADFRHAHHTAVELGEWRLEAVALIGVGRALHIQGRTDHAHQTWAKALDVYLDVEAHTAAASLRETLVTCCTSAAAS